MIVDSFVRFSLDSKILDVAALKSVKEEASLAFIKHRDVFTILPTSCDPSKTGLTHETAGKWDSVFARFLRQRSEKLPLAGSDLKAILIGYAEQ